MRNFLKKFIPCTKRDIDLLHQGQKEIDERLSLVDGQMKETLERLRNIEAEIVVRLSHSTKRDIDLLHQDGQMKETLERLRNIEAEMVVRLSNIEEKEDNIIQNSPTTIDKKIHIRLLGKE